MADTYRIGNINLSFEYVFDKYFLSRIMDYKADVFPEYRMRVVIRDNLVVPEGKIRYRFDDRTIIEYGTRAAIVKRDDKGMITHLITYSPDYKDITIELVKALGSRLPDIEYMITGMMFFEMAVSRGLLPIHASAIGHDGEAILFSGPSGAGKSTQAELWQQNLEDVIFINDDKPLLYETEVGLYVTGSPWSGKTSRNKNVTMKVKAIIFIEKSTVNHLEALSVHDKINFFLRNIYRPREEAKIDNVLELVEKMIRDLPVYRYFCGKDIEAFEYLYQALYRRDY